MTSSPAGIRALLLDDQQRLVEAVRCTRCGYNLQMLTRDDACPECGTPAAASIRDDLLQLYPDKWLGKLRWAGILMVPALLYGPIVDLIFYVTYMVLDILLLTLYTFGFLPRAWLLLIAGWLLTARPHPVTTMAQLPVTIGLRVLLIVTVVASNLYALVIYAVWDRLFKSGIGDPVIWIHQLSGLFVSLSFALLIAGLTWYARGLLLRIPAMQTARWLLVIGLIASAGFLLTGVMKVTMHVLFLDAAGADIAGIYGELLWIMAGLLDWVFFGLTQIALVWLAILAIRSVRMIGAIRASKPSSDHAAAA